MNITAALVKELRERTGAGMMDCKKALVATEGDMEKPLTICVKRASPRLPRRLAVSRRKALSFPTFPKTAR